MASAFAIPLFLTFALTTSTCDGVPLNFFNFFNFPIFIFFKVKLVSSTSLRTLRVVKRFILSYAFRVTNAHFSKGD